MKLFILTWLSVWVVWKQNQISRREFLYLLFIQNPLVAFYWEQVAIYLTLGWITTLLKVGCRRLKNSFGK